VGIDTLAAALSEERDTIEEVVEPFLLKLGFLQRTPRGRIISPSGYKYLGIKTPSKQVKQYELLEGFDDV
jgi:Holliday junction DNA helicase RuvB